MNEELRKEAIRLYKPGTFGYKQVAQELGVSHTTVRRWVNPETNRRHLQMARDAKRRRRGTCERCGAETRYGGHKRHPGGVSRYCVPCGEFLSGERGRALRGTGPVQRKTLELLAERPHRFMEICRALGKPKGAIGPHLDRLMRYGLVVRPKRGLYALAEREER